MRSKRSYRLKEIDTILGLIRVKKNPYTSSLPTNIKKDFRKALNFLSMEKDKLTQILNIFHKTKVWVLLKFNKICEAPEILISYKR